MIISEEKAGVCVCKSDGLETMALKIMTKFGGMLMKKRVGRLELNRFGFLVVEAEYFFPLLGANNDIDRILIILSPYH